MLHAALAWYGMLKEAKGDRTPIGERIADFWEELSARETLEILFDQTVTDHFMPRERFMVNT